MLPVVAVVKPTPGAAEGQQIIKRSVEPSWQDPSLCPHPGSGAYGKRRVGRGQDGGGLTSTSAIEQWSQASIKMIVSSDPYPQQPAPLGLEASKGVGVDKHENEMVTSTTRRAEPETYGDVALHRLPRAEAVGGGNQETEKQERTGQGNTEVDVPRGASTHDGPADLRLPPDTTTKHLIEPDKHPAYSNGPSGGVQLSTLGNGRPKRCRLQSWSGLSQHYRGQGQPGEPMSVRCTDFHGVHVEPTTEAAWFTSLYPVTASPQGGVPPSIPSSRVCSTSGRSRVDPAASLWSISMRAEDPWMRMGWAPRFRREDWKGRGQKRLAYLPSGVPGTGTSGGPYHGWTSSVSDCHIESGQPLGQPGCVPHYDSGAGETPALTAGGAANQAALGFTDAEWDQLTPRTLRQMFPDGNHVNAGLQEADLHTEPAGLSHKACFGADSADGHRGGEHHGVPLAQSVPVPDGTASAVLGVTGPQGSVLRGHEAQGGRPVVVGEGRQQPTGFSNNWTRHRRDIPGPGVEGVAEQGRQGWSPWGLQSPVHLQGALASSPGGNEMVEVIPCSDEDDFEDPGGPREPASQSEPYGVVVPEPARGPLQDDRDIKLGKAGLGGEAFHDDDKVQGTLPRGAQSCSSPAAEPFVMHQQGCIGQPVGLLDHGGDQTGVHGGGQTGVHDGGQTGVHGSVCLPGTVDGYLDPHVGPDGGPGVVSSIGVSQCVVVEDQLTDRPADVSEEDWLTIWEVLHSQERATAVRTLPGRSRLDEARLCRQRLGGLLAELTAAEAVVVNLKSLIAEVEKELEALS